MPRTPAEMRSRIAQIRLELEDLEQRCLGAGRAEYRRLSDEMNALGEEWQLWERVIARIEAKQAAAAYNSGFQAVAAARAAVSR